MRMLAASPAIIVGDLKDIRAGRNWGDSGNQKLHRRPFERIIRMLTYKARLKGISVVHDLEDYTSQTCSICGQRRKHNRVHRRLYVCSRRHAMINADVNGAINILKRYLLERTSVSWS